MAKKEHKSQIFVKILAGILVVLMLVSVAGTLLYYVVGM